MVKITKRQKSKLEFNAIRKCSSECYFFKNGGEGCLYFQKQEVEYGESCLYDLTQIKEYVDAFATGDNTKVKEDAAGITGMVMLQIRRMLEQVNVEGVTVQEPITDAKGQPIWIPDPNWDSTKDDQRPMIVAMRVKDHPLIARCIQLARAIDINLSEFKLTPKSADEKKMISGHIVSENPEDIKKVMEDRALIEEKFVEAIQKGNELTEKDPIYKKLTEGGEVME